MQVSQRHASPSQNMVAPVTGNDNKDLMRAEIKQGIREVVLCKDAQGMLGLRVRHVNNVICFSFLHSLLLFKIILMCLPVLVAVSSVHL